MSLKIVFLGGGSGFFNMVLGEFMLTPGLAGSEIVLYDVAAERMEIIEGIGQRMIEQGGADLKISSTTDLARAVDGADFAVASIGKMGPDWQAHDLDMTIPAKYGIIQTTGDTVGPGGLSMALRIIPAFIEIGREMEKRCPDCVFINHSNPMSVICRSLVKYVDLRCVIGLCHGVQGTIAHLADVLGVEVEDLEVRAAGLNHLLWVLTIRHKGQNVYPLLRKKIAARDPEPVHIFADALFRIYGYYPVNADRHIIEFFPYLRQARTEEELPYQLGSRHSSLKEPAVAKSREKWDKLAKQARGELAIELPEKISPEAVGAIIPSLATGREEVHIVNSPNQGSIPNLPDFALVETLGITDSTGCRPIYMGPLPDAVVGMLQARVMQQEVLVDAAVKGDRQLALQALAADPMILSLEEAQSLLDELLKAQAQYLPHFQ